VWVNQDAIRRGRDAGEIGGAEPAPSLSSNHAPPGGQDMNKHARKHDRGPISRRAFVGGAVGAGVVAAGGSAVVVGAAAPDSARSARSGAARSPLNFGRMFPELPPFAEATDDVRASLRELGRPGGIMDANDDLAAGPVALIVDANLNVVNRNNTSHSAGTTFVGQFADRGRVGMALPVWRRI
jgi:hypothetical protein